MILVHIWSENAILSAVMSKLSLLINDRLKASRALGAGNQEVLHTPNRKRGDDCLKIAGCLPMLLRKLLVSDATVSVST